MIAFCLGVIVGAVAVAWIALRFNPSKPTPATSTFSAVGVGGRGQNIEVMNKDLLAKVFRNLESGNS